MCLAWKFCFQIEILLVIVLMGLQNECREEKKSWTAKSDRKLDRCEFKNGISFQTNWIFKLQTSKIEKFDSKRYEDTWWKAFLHCRQLVTGIKTTARSKIHIKITQKTESWFFCLIFLWLVYVCAHKFDDNVVLFFSLKFSQSSYCCI